MHRINTEFHCFSQMNPQHTVPTLDDNGQILWESHAIVTYLVDKYCKDDSLYPKNLYIRAKVNQRLHFDSSILFTRARPCTEAVFLKGATEFPQSGIKEILSAYDFMEAFLKDDPYFVGNNLTVADLCIAANFSTTQIAAPLDAAKYPKLAAWFVKIKKLPYYNEVNGKRVEKFRNFIMGRIEANKLAAAANI